MSGSAATIPLDVWHGQGVEGPQGALGMAMPLVDMQSKILQMQNLRNQQQMFQAQYQARSKMGQIMAQAPDLESGLTAATKDPDVMAFGGEALKEARSMQQIMLQSQGLEQSQNNSALEAVAKATAMAVGDPSRFPDILQAQMSALPPAIRERAAPAIMTYAKSLTSGLPADPAQAQATFQQRAIGLTLGAGIDPQKYEGLLGKSTTQALGNRVISGVQLPPQLGGGFAGATSLGMGAPPGWQTPGSAPVPGLGPNGGAGTAPGMGGNGLNTPAQTGVERPNALVPPDPTRFAPTANNPRGAGGVPILSPAQNNEAIDLAKSFSGDELRGYNAAQNVMGNLQLLDGAIDTLAKGGGFQVPGTLGTFRNQLARAVNTITQTTGGADKLPFPAEKVAASEELYKLTNTLAFQVTQQYLGTQREAAETINKSLQSVPGIENSVLGAKLVSDGLKASAQRMIDLREFKREWMNRPENAGNLSGADEAFAKLHPPSQYVDGVLNKYGMTEKGFGSAEDVGRAFKLGYLTRDQARQLLTGQFKFGASDANSR